MLAVFTVCTTHHVHRARVLMASVKEHLPEAQRYVMLADPLQGRFDPAQEDFNTVEPMALPGVEDWPRLRFLIPPSGLCCVLKPIGALHVLATSAADAVIYLDADTWVLDRPESLLAAVDRHAVVLTPHCVRVSEHPLIATETMRSGAFNAGVFAVRRDPVAKEFLTWWGANMLDPAKMSLAWNYDQGWLNLAPTAFPDLHVLRDPGCNVAFWNLHEREISASPVPPGIRAVDRPVSLFHFSFFDWRTPDRLAGPHSKNLPAPPEVIRQLQRRYAAALQASGADEVETWPYPFAHFSDGHPVREVHRDYFRQRVDGRLPAGADPFDVTLQLPGLRGLKSLRRADAPMVRAMRYLRQLGRKG